MFDIQEHEDEHLLEVRMSGVLHGTDYESLEPHLDAMIAKHGKVRLLCDATAWEGISPDAFWEDFKLGVSHYLDFERVAIIGKEEWMSWATKVGDALTPYEMRFFGPAQRDIAQDWIKS